MTSGNHSPIPPLERGVLFLKKGPKGRASKFSVLRVGGVWSKKVCLNLIGLECFLVFTLSNNYFTLNIEILFMKKIIEKQKLNFLICALLKLFHIE